MLSFSSNQHKFYNKGTEHLYTIQRGLSETGQGFNLYAGILTNYQVIL